jgi:hypothetical protein
MATKTKAPTVKITVSTFDASQRPTYRVVRSGVKLAKYQPVTAADYSPRGGTPLLDAVVEFLEDIFGRTTKEEVAVGILMDESGSMGDQQQAVISAVNEFVLGLRDVDKVDPETAGKGFLVICTDGEENSSTRHTKKDVAKLLRKAEKNSWAVMFFGAGIDAWDEGRGMGFGGNSISGQTVSSVPTAAGTRSAMAFATSDRNSYLRSAKGYTLSKQGQNSTSVDESGKVSTDNINKK